MFSYKEYIKNNFIYIFVFSSLIYFTLDVFIISNISYLKFLLLFLIIIAYIFINKENEAKIFENKEEYHKIFEIIDVKFKYILADYQVTILLKNFYDYIKNNNLEYKKLLENINTFLKIYRNTFKKNKNINYSNNLDILYQLRNEILNITLSFTINIYSQKYIKKYNLLQIILKEILNKYISNVEGLMKFLWNKGIINRQTNISNLYIDNIKPNPIDLNNYSENYSLN